MLIKQSSISDFREKKILISQIEKKSDKQKRNNSNLNYFCSTILDAICQGIDFFRSKAAWRLNLHHRRSCNMAPSLKYKFITDSIHVHKPGTRGEEL